MDNEYHLRSQYATLPNDKHRKARVVPLDLNPLVGSTVTVDGYSRVYELGDASILRVHQAVATVSTDDTLDTVIQTSKDGTTWYTAGAFTQVTADAASEYKDVPVNRFVRLLFNVGGAAAISIGGVVITAEAVY